MRVKLLVIFIIFTILSVSLGLGILAYKTIYLQNTPEVLIKEYYSAISKQDYETMYGLLCQQSQKEMLKDDFIRRNSAIYEGIGISKLKIYFDENKKHKADSVKYDGYIYKVVDTKLETTPYYTIYANLLER